MRPIAAIQISITTLLAGGAALLATTWLADAPIPSPAAVAPVPAKVHVVVPSDPGPQAVPEPPPEPPRCCACAMEDNRRKSREQQRVIEARFVGVERRVDTDGKHTTRRCTVDHKVWATVRFELTDLKRKRRMVAALPCPELSRDAYKTMYGITAWHDDEDGLGTAPKLERGATYKLRVVDDATLVGDADNMNEHHWTLLAVDPR